MENLEQIINFLLASVIIASPLIVAAMGGMYSEKSGIVNIGLEGIMTFAAFVGAITILFVENNFGIVGFIPLTIGLLGAIAGGLIFAFLHGFLTIKFKVDQIISGTIINILGLALAIFLTGVLNGGSAATAYKASFSIKILGLPLIVILILLLIPVSIYIMKYTRWGLRVKACGENPEAVLATGINVNKVRFQAVLMSGVFGAIGGYALLVLFSGSFSSATVAGKGFIALAILIFGQWEPIGILLAGLLFGILSNIGVNATRIFTGDIAIPFMLLIMLIIIFIIMIKFIRNGLVKVLLSIAVYFTLLLILFTNQSIPSVYFDILPYIITIVALTYYSKKSAAPAALGK